MTIAFAKEAQFDCCGSFRGEREVHPSAIVSRPKRREFMRGQTLQRFP
jgi:hypothetical protein